MEEEAPTETETVEVPTTAPMAAMSPEIATVIARELAKAIVNKEAAQPPQVIDIESLPLDLFGMIPKYGRRYWYKGWKRDPTDSSRVIYDIYVSPMKISKILAKASATIETRWGPEKTNAYILWTVTKARTYDPINKRVVPIRQIVMTPLMARRGADVAKLLDMLTPQVIKQSVEIVSRHESLLWADMARMKAQEAATAWEIVEKKAESHFESTERMLKYAGEATDKGDDAFAKSFTEEKGGWKERLADNWCIISLFVLVAIYMVGYGLGWWTQ